MSEKNIEKETDDFIIYNKCGYSKYRLVLKDPNRKSGIKNELFLELGYIGITSPYRKDEYALYLMEDVQVVFVIDYFRNKMKGQVMLDF